MTYTCIIDKVDTIEDVRWKIVNPETGRSVTVHGEHRYARYNPDRIVGNQYYIHGVKKRWRYPSYAMRYVMDKIFRLKYGRLVKKVEVSYTEMYQVYTLIYDVLRWNSEDVTIAKKGESAPQIMQDSPEEMGWTI